MKFFHRFMRLILGGIQRLFNIGALGEWPPFAGVAVIIRKEEKILFIARSDGAGYGLPGGFIRLHETASLAAVRETKEETGFDVKLISLVGELSGKRGKTWVRTADFIFEAEIVGGEMQHSSEGECGWFDPNEIRDNIAFDYHKILLNQ